MDRDVRVFELEILGSTVIHELPCSWPTASIRSLLRTLEVDGVDDVADDDAMELCLMALQDLGVDEASDRVLEAVFADRMRSGVRHNLISDLRDDRPWEDFAEIAQQAGIFEATVLLQKAFPREFGRPDALALRLRIGSESQTGRRWLDAPSPDAGLLLRIVAGAMDDRAVLRRLLGASLEGDRFPEARGILWRVERLASDGASSEFELISSHQWFDAVPARGTFSVRAWLDKRVTDDD